MVKRATAFLGAGAVVGIGGPTTRQLTSAVRHRKQRNFSSDDPKEIPFIKRIADALDKYYARDEANFEDIFHAIETLESLYVGLEPKTAKPFKPAIGAFVAPPSDMEYDPIIFDQGLNHIVEEVANHVVRFMAGFQPNGIHRWFADLWREATKGCPWDIATLNYDDCVERSLDPGSWEDGFVELDPGLFRFDPARFIRVEETRILHLHGSVFYGYPHFRDPNRFNFEDQHEDLYRFASHEDAEDTWFGRSQNYAQSGESAIAGPIITGQRKPDKLLGIPYSTYQSVLHDAVLKNPSLLIIGYSFGDIHFNRLLSRLTRHHGDNRRVVVIDYVPEDSRGDSWAPDGSIRGWPDVDMFHEVARLARDTQPLDGSYHHPWISKDGLCRFYLEGFEEAVVRHGTEILEFLLS